MLKLTMFCPRYLGSKTILTSIKFTGNFEIDITCLLLPISQATLGWFQHFGGVSESSGRAEFKTVIGIQFWARIHGEKRETVGDKWND